MSGVTTIGFDEFRGKLSKLPEEVLNEIDGECLDAARMWEQLAKNAAPVKYGRLRANITSSKVAYLNYQVTSQVFYSPYQEFGTGLSVDVQPPELAQYALQFKRGGTTKGIKPHRFFFIYKHDVETFFIGRVTSILSRER